MRTNCPSDCWQAIREMEREEWDKERDRQKRVKKGMKKLRQNVRNDGRTTLLTQSQFSLFYLEDFKSNGPRDLYMLDPNIRWNNSQDTTKYNFFFNYIFSSIYKKHFLKLYFFQNELFLHGPVIRSNGTFMNEEKQRKSEHSVLAMN